MGSIRAATRYAQSSGAESDSSPSSELAVTREVAPKNDSGKINFGFMMKKLVDGKKCMNPKFVAAAEKAAGLGELHKKFFKVKIGAENEKTVLTEVKANTRTLGMVLRSERELLSRSKQQQEEITDLKSQLEVKIEEVEKLKDLCLKQMEEIKSLKSFILFPDAMNSHLQDLVEKQGSELVEAKQLIPSLQRQISSLTGQLRCLAEDLAEVKAEKYAGRGFCNNRTVAPKTASSYIQDVLNSSFDQEFISGDYNTTPGSPDELFLKDLNPCLTPYKIDSQQFDD